MKQSFIAIFIALVAFVPVLKAEEGVAAKDESHQAIHGFVDFNYFLYETRDFNTFNINILLLFPYDISYFALIDINNPVDTDKNQDLENLYSEHQINWGPSFFNPWMLSSQWVIVSGPDNDVLRFGPTLKVSSIKYIDKVMEVASLYYQVSFWLGQVDSRSGFNWQIEHYYHLDILPDKLDNRFYLDGFADNDHGPNGDTWVHEHQFGIRLIGSAYFVTEYRHNDFLADSDGVGIGVQYKANF